MSKTIVIDAGHGMNTAGRRCLKSLDPKETGEWFLNDRIADLLQFLLSDYDCKIIRADDTTGATDVSRSTRVSIANNAKADFYLSIHHNAGINGGTGGGLMVFYYSDNKMKKMAQGLYDSILKETGLKGNRSQPVSCYGYDVIANTKMPALLVECGFMDSATDVPIILKYDFAEKTAKGMLNWIVSEFDLEKRNTLNAVETPIQNDEKSKKLIYRVQVGAYSVRANADAQIERLKKAGFSDAFITSTYIE